MPVTADSLNSRVPAEGTENAYNNSGADIGKHLMVRRTGGEYTEIALPSASSDPCWGATLNAIADGSLGPIQTAGKALVYAGAAFAAGVRLTVDTSGRVIPWAPAAGANAAMVGMSNTAAGAPGDLVEVFLSAPFTVQQG